MDRLKVTKADEHFGIRYDAPLNPNLPDAWCPACNYLWRAVELPDNCWACGEALREMPPVMGGVRVAGAAIICFVCVLIGAAVVAACVLM